MSILTRSEIIAEARSRAGRKGQEISLVNAFDFILQKMTRDYPLLRNISHPFTTVANMAFVPLPLDYRSWEQCFYDTYEMSWIEPEEYLYLTRVYTDTGSSPSKFTVSKRQRRLYLWNKPSEAKNGYFYYSAIHPRVDKSLAFTSGGTYEIRRGDTVQGEIGSATMLVSFVWVTSGSWDGGDAAGVIMGSVTGTFQSETLKVGSSLDVATITGDATSKDNFQHFLGEEFDEVVIEGVAWKCMELISGKDAIEKALTKDKKKDFEDLLSDADIIDERRVIKTQYRDF